MSIGALLLVSLSVGMSNFAASIGIGLSGVDARTRIRIGLAFGFFEAVMPVVGLAIGQSLAGQIGTIGHYIGSVLLVLTGLYVVWQAHMGKTQALDAGQVRRLGTAQLFFTALALSIDNLIVGFALSFAQVPVALAAVVIAAVSVVLSLLGLELGQRLGSRVEQWSEEIGGAVLILVGVALAFDPMS